MKRIITLAIIALAACSARAQNITFKGIDQIAIGSSRQQTEKIIGKGNFMYFTVDKNNVLREIATDRIP